MIEYFMNSWQLWLSSETKKPQSLSVTESVKQYERQHREIIGLLQTYQHNFMKGKHFSAMCTGEN